MALLYSRINEALYTRDALRLLPTPVPQGRYHHPLPFGEYADFVADSLEREGFGIVKEEYAVNKANDKMFGLMEVAPLEGELIRAKDWTVQVGIRGSHDQSIPRGLTLGSRVLVCSNLCFHGSLGTFKTKQTTAIMQRLPAMIRRAVSLIPQMAKEQERHFEAYKNLELSPRQGDAALVELYRRDAFTSGQLARAIAEWDNPSYADHGELGYTGWRLLNASTEALKPTGERVNYETIRERSEKVSRFIAEAAGL